MPKQVSQGQVFPPGGGGGAAGGESQEGMHPLYPRASAWNPCLMELLILAPA